MQSWATGKKPHPRTWTRAQVYKKFSGRQYKYEGRYLQFSPKPILLGKPTNHFLILCRITHLPWYTITDKPIVSVSRTTDEMLEEGRSSVTLECQADANPPARIFWKKMGPAEQRQYTERLEFNPVMRKDSGSYICQAENSLGLSNEEPAEIDVLCELCAQKPITRRVIILFFIWFYLPP